MSNRMPNAGKPWTEADMLRLEVMANTQRPLAFIAKRLGRSESAVVRRPRRLRYSAWAKRQRAG